MKTYYGVKTGMKQVWTKSGLRLPVTIIKAEPMVVTQVKTVEKDGYTAVQVGVGSRRKKEIRLNEASTQAAGDKINLSDVLEVGDIVKVTGASKGRGFSGPMKRWGFHGGPKTHGQSDRWRAPGSIGQGTTPGRVLKGRHMAGRYGGETYAIRNLQVVKINPDTQEVWVNGPIPGTRQSIVAIEVTKKGQFEGLREDAPIASVTETTVQE